MLDKGKNILHPALELLAQMKFESLCKQHPNIPLHALPHRKYSDKTANDLTLCIMDFLRLKGCYCVRINTTGFYTGSRWIKGTTAKGTADLHAVINSRHVSIEVKAGKDRLSNDQRRQASLIEQAGGIYIVARNFQCFYDWFISNQLESGKH